MSNAKQRAQAEFAGIAQRDLAAAGYYRGAMDDWPGPLTRLAWREAMGLLPRPEPPVAEPEAGTALDDLPQPAERYALPRETREALTAAYGSPSENPPYLGWFSFPHPATRLYTRTGELLRDREGDARQDHRCHRLLVGRLTAALAEIYVRLGREQFQREGWHVYGGCHNYRAKTGGSSLSTHAWGIAVDLNPNENPYARTTTTFGDEGIDAMERWGFLSGGRAWGKDWMHFQAAIPSISAGSHYARHGLPRNVVAA